MKVFGSVTAGSIALGAVLAASLCAATYAGQTSIKIGVLTDLSSFGSVAMGPGSIVGAQIAVQDFGGQVLGKPIEVISADMQSKPDLAVALARQWYDVENVDLIIDVPASAAAIAIQNMAYEKKKSFIGTVAATTELSGKGCTPNSIHWGIDTSGMSRGLVNALAQEGAKTWFFIMPDYAVGKSLAENAQAAIEAQGGRVVGSAFFPPNNSDYATFLLRAQQSGADVIGTGAIGLDLNTLIKQAAEFGILPSSKQRLAAFVMNLSDVDSVGLQTTQNVWLVTDFYWDMNDSTRAFAKKFFAVRNKMPNYTHAENYSGVLAYLNAVKEAGTDDAAVVAAKMKEKPQPRFGDMIKIRKDGRALADVALYQVKSPAESKAPWDYLKLVRRISSAQTYGADGENGCPLVKP